jgi:hypothetical protein
MSVSGSAGPNVVGFTAARAPGTGFRPAELEFIRDQVRDLPLGSVVVQGGCRDGDAIIGRAAHARGLHVVTILPGAQWREDTAHDYIDWSDEVHDSGKHPLSRNQDIVAHSARVRGVALYEGETDVVGRLRSRRQPRSGTWATLRLAQLAGKLERILTLRPTGLPGPILQELRNGRLIVVEHLRPTQPIQEDTAPVPMLLNIRR